MSPGSQIDIGNTSAKIGENLVFKKSALWLESIHSAAKPRKLKKALANQYDRKAMGLDWARA